VKPERLSDREATARTEVLPCDSTFICGRGQGAGWSGFSGAAFRPPMPIYHNLVCPHVSTHSSRRFGRTGHGDGTAARRPRTIKIGGPANVYVGSVRLQIESASLKITVKSRTIGHTTVRQVGPMVLGWHTHAPLGH